MPRNAVYGKRRNAGNAFAAAGTYSWSPSKISPGVKIHQDEAAKDLDSVVDKLANLSVKTGNEKPKKTVPQKNVLACGDGNPVRLAAKTKAKAISERTENERDAAKPTTKSRGGRAEPISQSVPKDIRRGRYVIDSDTSHSSCSAAQSDSDGVSVKELSLRRSPRKSPRKDYAEHPTKLSKNLNGTNKSATNPPQIRPPFSLPKASDDPLTAYTSPLLALCSEPSGRTSPTPFSTWSDALSAHLHITKIAEASYGEVYRLSPRSHIHGFSRSDESVLKVIALKPPTLPTGRNGRVSKRDQERVAMMSSVENVRSEIQLMQRMTSTPGFTNFREVRVLKGRPASAFVEAWKEYNKTRRRGEKSLFPNPGLKGSYDEEQLWAVVEMQDAGTDLENVAIKDVWGVWDVIWGVALALGKGEEESRFEVNGMAI